MRHRLLLALFLCVGCADTSGAGGTTVGSGPSSGTGNTGEGAMSPGTGGESMGEGGSGMAPGAGGAGASGSSTSSSTGSGVCLDQGIGEANETIDAATEMAGGTDCDELSAMGTIDGADDADWYLWVQTGDESTCNVNPARDWAVDSGHTLRVCKYVQCQVDDLSPDTVDCGDGSVPDTHAGLDGCCGSLPFDVGIGFFGCDGSDDLLNVYTRVDEPEAAADTCAGYNLNYTF